MILKTVSNFLALCECLEPYGLSDRDVEQLLLYARILNRWGVLQASGITSRDGQYTRYIDRDDDGKVYYIKMHRYGLEENQEREIRDMEQITLNQIEDMMRRTNPTLRAYHQTDPRGVSLYLLKPGEKETRIPFDGIAITVS